MPSINNVRCILIIGSTSGLGRALALSILDLPSKPTVLVCGRRQERLDELVSSYGADGRLKAINLDVNTGPAALKSAIHDIVKTYPDVCFPVFYGHADELIAHPSSMQLCFQAGSSMSSISVSLRPLT